MGPFWTTAQGNVPLVGLSVRYIMGPAHIRAGKCRRRVELSPRRKSGCLLGIIVRKSEQRLEVAARSLRTLG